ncbi:hypothetical protein AB1L05_17635 [Cytobacillus horneckiae]|uniref:hypothetical protein n=1 Tax=Cytobacillus horneckiae TaxID=549687 RepID=UPI00399FA33A
MDVLVEYLLTLAKAIITQIVAYLFSMILNKKSKNKTAGNTTLQRKITPKC